MSSAPSPAPKPTVRQPSAPTPSTRAAPARPQAQHVEADGKLLTAHDEEALLKLNLSDLPIPKIGGLQVEGLKPSLIRRLFGRK